MNNTQVKRIGLKQIALVSVVGILLILISFFVYSTFFTPKPLGNQLDLIERKYFGYLPFDDSDFTVDYYYSTDMTLEEFTTYFKNAKLVEPPRRNLGVYQVRFLNIRKNVGFTLTYYTHEEALQKITLVPDKKLVIVPDRYYNIARESL